MRPGFWVAAILAAGSVSAQTGGLRVVVTDGTTRKPLPGAAVVLSSATRQVTTTSLRTGSAGVAEFPVLRAGGGYTLSVSLAGYTPLDVQDVRVPAGTIAVLPVALVPGLQESMAVSAVREGVDLEETRTSVLLTSEFTEALPVYGRFYQSLLTLAPGVLDSDEDGNPNVLGARETDFKTEVGGVANTDPLTGGFLSYINLESVEALEIIPAGAGVEFARAQGGFASIVQKQGSNSLEGVGGILFGSSLLDGNGASGGEVPVPEFERWQPFFQISGPILRDRLWYRLSHEWIDREDPINVVSRIEVTKQRQGIHSDQLTWQVTPRNKLALQVQRDPLELQNIGVGTYVTAENSHALERGGTTTSLHWTAPYSANVFAEGLAALQDHHENVLPMVAGVPTLCGLSDFYPLLSRARCTEVKNQHISGSYPIDSRDQRRRFTLRGEVTAALASQGAVRHQLKAGLSVENERYFRTLQRGNEGHLYPKNFWQPLVGRYLVEIHVPDTTVAESSGSAAGVFLEDQIHFGARLTLTAGLRADREVISGETKEGFDPAAEAAHYAALVAGGVNPADALGMAFTGFDGGEDYQQGLDETLGGYLVPISPLLQQSGSWPRKRELANLQIADTTLSPRLALAWDPTGSGKTKLALTAGRYHDKVFLSVPLLASEAPTTQMLFDVGHPDFFDRGWYVFNTRGPAENGRVTVVDPGLRTPYQDEVTLSAERELWPETSVKLTVVRRRFRDQLQDVDLNHVPGDRGRCEGTFSLDDPALIPSPGAGQTLVAPYTGEFYVDTDPGPGDGKTDDCLGVVVYWGGLMEPPAHRPDGLPDLYPLNPAWGQLMRVQNANTADFSAALLELSRRYSHGWALQASYTWSRAVGDAEAFDQLLGDEPNLLHDERSYLAYDQRHVVKLTGAVDTGWDWRLGSTVRWESGLPYSQLESIVSYYGIAPEYGVSFPLPQLRDAYVGKRNAYRNPGFWTVDARVAREFMLSKDRIFGLTFEVFNLLNDDTLRILEVQDGTVRGVRRFGRRFQIGLRASF